MIKSSLKIYNLVVHSKILKVNPIVLQLVTLETTLRLYWRDPRLKVDHLMAANSSENAYVLLNPESASFIWFPDIYIGKLENKICTDSRSKIS
jgi:hypothetical protein